MFEDYTCTSSYSICFSCKHHTCISDIYDRDQLFLLFIYQVQVEFWICLLLTFFGWIPGIIYAVYVIVKWLNHNCCTFGKISLSLLLIALIITQNEIGEDSNGLIILIVESLIASLNGISQNQFTNAILVTCEWCQYRVEDIQVWPKVLGKM